MQVDFLNLSPRVIAGIPVLPVVPATGSLRKKFLALLLFLAYLQ